MSFAEQEKRARARVEPVIVRVCASANVDVVRLKIVRRGTSASVGYGRGNQLVIRFPLLQALTADDEQIEGTIGHEVSHVKLRNIPSNCWSDSKLKIGAALVVAALIGGVAGVAIALMLWPQSVPANPNDTMQSVFVGTIAGGVVFLGVFYLLRPRNEPPGWEGVSSRELELATDIAAIGLVGKQPLISSRKRGIPRTRIGRFLVRLRRDHIGVGAPHPSSEARVNAVRAYDGTDPKTYAREFLNQIAFSNSRGLRDE